MVQVRFSDRHIILLTNLFYKKQLNLSRRNKKLSEPFSFQVFQDILDRLAIRRSLLPEERLEHQVRPTRQLNSSEELSHLLP